MSQQDDECCDSDTDVRCAATMAMTMRVCMCGSQAEQRADEEAAGRKQAQKEVETEADGRLAAQQEAQKQVLQPSTRNVQRYGRTLRNPWIQDRAPSPESRIPKPDRMKPCGSRRAGANSEHRQIIDRCCSECCEIETSAEDHAAASSHPFCQHSQMAASRSSC